MPSTASSLAWLQSMFAEAARVRSAVLNSGRVPKLRAGPRSSIHPELSALRSRAGRTVTVCGWVGSCQPLPHWLQTRSAAIAACCDLFRVLAPLHAGQVVRGLVMASDSAPLQSRRSVLNCTDHRSPRRASGDPRCVGRVRRGARRHSGSTLALPSQFALRPRARCG